MSTIMLKQFKPNNVALSADFVDIYMPKAKGEYVKIYIMLLRYTQLGELGVTASFLAENLGILENDVIKALDYWDNLGILKVNTYDGMGNISVEIMQSSNILDEASIPNKKEGQETSISNPMLSEIELLLNRPLSSSDMEKFLYFKEEYNFPEEVVILLVQHCVQKDITNLRYMEQVAITWHSEGITSIELAQQNIKSHEDKWTNYRKVLNYLGIKEKNIMKPQEDLLEKWFYDYEFTTDMIINACDISFNNLGKGEIKYIDGILRSWYNDGIKNKDDIKKQEEKFKAKGKKKNTTTKDFEEREYDYDELEKKLLGWD
ncbi:MAG: DnaD domain protein [Clostridium sp.]|nr:DnaD domain protein [Clostridium sp.]